MRITLEYTTPAFKAESGQASSISVASVQDDLNVYEVGQLLEGLLLGAGYSPDSVDDLLGDVLGKSLTAAENPGE